MTIKKSSPNSKKLAVIGGGPIGLFLSIKLAEKGHEISVFEKGVWPIDKVCGQGIMPEGSKLLQEVGLEFNNTDSYEFESIKYFDGELCKGGMLHSNGIGVERSILSQKLYEKAKSFSNIQLHQKTNIMGDLQENFDYVFACDGLNSQTREFYGNAMVRRGEHRMGARLHYDGVFWGDGVETYWSDGVEAYITPVAKDRFEVAFLWFESEFEKGANLEKKLFQRFPQLKEKLDNYQRVNDFRGYGPFKKVSRKMRVQNVFFVGDAYKFLDGITGEGLSLGMKSASIIADSFDNFTLRDSFKIQMNYLNYKFWVSFALFLSRATFLRRMILRLFGRKSFNLIFRLNDLGFKS